MKRKFFEEPKLSEFEKKILSCLAKKNEFEDDDLDLPLLAECILELTKLTSNYQFTTINPGLKGEALKVLQMMQELMPTPSFFIQIPAKEYISQMKGMPAGGKEDQQQRLMHMVDTIQEIQGEHSSLPVITSNQVELIKEWGRLFAAINSGDKEKAFLELNKIPPTDIVLQSILAVHPVEYLKVIIGDSIDAIRTGIKKINADVIITPKTFEILIYDIATTLLNPAKINFSFGLPSHHASNAEGSGFCILNKTAIILKHTELTHMEQLKYIIVGTDVNRDNGLCAILMRTASHLDVCHVDIFDSRVYPQQDHSFISKEFSNKGRTLGQKIKCWQQEHLKYYAVDLSLTTRSSVSVHPALLFALKKIKETITTAQKNNQKVMLLLPTGWDSHENETAFCGKYIDGHFMTKSDASKMRFNDGDLVYFYEKILDLYYENKECIEGIYWGLEGGYDKPMYEKQIQLMLDVLMTQLIYKDADQHSQRMQY